MVQLNEDNVFGFALKWRECRMYMQYEDCGLTVGLAEEFLPSKNYRKYRQHGSSLNRDLKQQDAVKKTRRPSYSN